MNVRIVVALALVLAGSMLAPACRDLTTNLVSDPLHVPEAGLDAAISSKPDAAMDAAKLVHDAGPALATVVCGDHVCACSDGRDNDGDGLIDGLDPECTGPSDDDEHSFATGAPQKPSDCRDCFWDDNAGNGDDGCRYPKECLTGTASSSKGACGSCVVSSRCIASCLPRTPNGCDCFGCCEITRPDGSTVHVALGDACSLDRLDDTRACPRCVQSSTCLNPCGRCELCPGRGQDRLAADCGAGASAGTPSYVCEGGAQVCAASAECASGAPYCQLGCCLPVVP